jgi:hypothetical protein
LNRSYTVGFWKAGTMTKIMKRNKLKNIKYENTTSLFK